MKSPVAWPFFTNQEKPFFVSWLAVGWTGKYLSPSSVSHASFRVGSRRRGLRRSLRDGVRSFLFFLKKYGLGGPKIGLGHRKMFKNPFFHAQGGDWAIYVSGTRMKKVRFAPRARSSRRDRTKVSGAQDNRRGTTHARGERVVARR